MPGLVAQLMKVNSVNHTHIWGNRGWRSTGLSPVWHSARRWWLLQWFKAANRQLQNTMPWRSVNIKLTTITAIYCSYWSIGRTTTTPTIPNLESSILRRKLHTHLKAREIPHKLILNQSQLWFGLRNLENEPPREIHQSTWSRWSRHEQNEKNNSVRTRPSMITEYCTTMDHVTIVMRPNWIRHYEISYSLSLVAISVCHSQNSSVGRAGSDFQSIDIDSRS